MMVTNYGKTAGWLKLGGGRTGGGVSGTVLAAFSPQQKLGKRIKAEKSQQDYNS